MAAALLLLAAASGCAHLLGGAATGPSGQSGWDRELRTLLAGGDHVRALSAVAPERARTGDELLRLQHAGLIAHYAGRWRESSESLERAHDLAEDRYTRSVSRILLSLVTSDRVIPYRPPGPERMLMHYYGALNYLRLGEPDEAAVEARRMGRLLPAGRGGGGGEVPRELAGGLSYFAGAVFEAAGQANDAGVAYRRARALGVGAVDSAVPAAGDSETGDVLVAVERGFVAHRAERSLTLFLLPCEVRRLRDIRRAAPDDGVASSRAASDDGAVHRGGVEADAADALHVASRVGERNLGWRTRGPHGGRRLRCEEGGDPVLVRVAWPVYRETGAVSGTAAVHVDGGPAPATPAVRLDLSAAARAAHRERRTLDLAKSLLRAVTKVAVAEGIEDVVSEEDEALGEVAGWTARLAGVLLERADTRSWHTLPARVDLYRMRLPAGDHRLEVVVRRDGGPDRRVDAGSVRVEPGAVTVVSARSWP